MTLHFFNPRTVFYTCLVQSIQAMSAVDTGMTIEKLLMAAKAEKSEAYPLVDESSHGKVTDLYGVLKLMVFLGGPYSLGAVTGLLIVFTSPKIEEDPTMENFNKFTIAACWSTYWVGWAVASITIMPYADRVGRKKPFYVLLGIGIFGAIAGALICRTPITYAAAVIAQGFCVPPAFGIAFLLLTESVPRRWIPPLTACANIGWCIVSSLLCLISWAAQGVDWRTQTILCNLPVMVLWMVGPFVVSESPKFVEAAEPDRTEDLASSTSLPDFAEGDASCCPSFGVLCSPPLRRTMVSTVICWVACSVGYYGLTYASGEITGNLYRDMFLMSIVDLVAYALPLPLMAQFGALNLQMGSMCAAALTLTICGWLPNGSMGVLVFSMIGRACIDMSFTTVYVLLVQCFPAKVCSSAMGLANFWSRFSAVICPFMLILPFWITCDTIAVICACAVFATADLKRTVSADVGGPLAKS